MIDVELNLTNLILMSPVFLSLFAIVVMKIVGAKEEGEGEWDCVHGEEPPPKKEVEPKKKVSVVKVEEISAFVSIDYDEPRDGFILVGNNGAVYLSEYFIVWRSVPSFRKVSYKEGNNLGEILKSSLLRSGLFNSNVDCHQVKKYVLANGPLKLSLELSDDILDLGEWYRNRCKSDRGKSVEPHRKKFKIRSCTGLF